MKQLTNKKTARSERTVFLTTPLCKSKKKEKIHLLKKTKRYKFNLLYEALHPVKQIPGIA